LAKSGGKRKKSAAEGGKRTQPILISYSTSMSFAQPTELPLFARILFRLRNSL
jgi:hypothetical protein